VNTNFSLIRDPHTPGRLEWLVAGHHTVQVCISIIYVDTPDAVLPIKLSWEHDDLTYYSASWSRDWNCISSFEMFNVRSINDVDVTLICWLNVLSCSYFFSYFWQLSWSYKLQNMFKNRFQSRFLSILYSLGYVGWWSYITFCHYAATLDNQDLMVFCCDFFRTKPLQIWDKDGTSMFMLDLFNLLSFYAVNTYPFCPWYFLCDTSTVSLAMELICQFPWHYPFLMIVCHSPLFA
jgi:hypothetical protein